MKSKGWWKQKSNLVSLDCLNQLSIRSSRSESSPPAPLSPTDISPMILASSDVFPPFEASMFTTWDSATSMGCIDAASLKVEECMNQMKHQNLNSWLNKNLISFIPKKNKWKYVEIKLTWSGRCFLETIWTKIRWAHVAKLSLQPLSFPCSGFNSKIFLTYQEPQLTVS